MVGKCAHIDVHGNFVTKLLPFDSNLQEILCRFGLASAGKEILAFGWFSLSFAGKKKQGKENQDLACPPNRM